MTVPYSNLTTSKEAADSVKESQPNLALEVLDVINGTTAGRMSAQGATCEEVETALDRSHQSTSSAIRRLALDGKIFDSRLRRHTRSGRKAIVWSPSNP